MNSYFSKNRIVQMVAFFLLFCLSATANAQIIMEQKAQEEFVCTEDKDMIIGKTTLEAFNQNQNFWIEYLFH